MLRLTLVLFIVGEALAEIKIAGPCPNQPALQGFDASKIAGVWYELAKYNKDRATMSRCVKVDHKLVENDAIEITNYQTPLKGGKPFSFKRTVTLESKPSNGQYKLSTGAPYNFLATDNENWAIVWSCTYSEGYSIRFARILSRTRNPTALVNRAAYNAASKLNLYTDDFMEAINTDCP